MNLVIPGVVVAFTFVLTLVSRLALESITGVPLSTAATAVIAAFWLGITLGVRWLWTRLRKKEKGNVAADSAAGGKP